MATRLRDALRETLVDWQNDLSPGWQFVLEGVELAFEAVDGTLKLNPWEPIFPSRRSFSLPGEPPGAHLFRAFDGLAPDSVRCVVIGQDPYPNIAFSTGRAFESGEHRHWRELDNMLSSTMRCLVQSIHAFRSGTACNAEDVDGWSETLRAVTAPGTEFPTPAVLAQSWVDQGVLLLNASLSLSRFAVEGDPHQTRGHLPLWRPLIVRILQHFAGRSSQPVVFCLFGEAAQIAAVESGVVKQAALHTDPAIVASPHPSKGNAYLKQANPFEQCNRKLEAMGASGIHW